MARKHKVLTFTRREASYDGPENAAIEKELQRAEKFFARGELVPESIWRAANTLLAERSRALSFSSKRTYLDAMRENLRRYPHLRLGTTRYMEDKHFPDVDFIDAEDSEHDAA